MPKAISKNLKAVVPKRQTQSDFIRSLPIETSVAEVVTKGRDAGLTISPWTVYSVRSAQRKAKGQVKPRGRPRKHPRAARWKSDPPDANPTSPQPSMSDFIRSQPADLSTAEVIAKGKESGMTISPGLVATVRSRHRTSKGSSIARAPVASTGPGPGFNSLEIRFVETALAIGFARASELLEQVKLKVNAMLR